MSDKRISEEQLNAIFKKAGEEHGLDVTAAFVPFSDVRIRWLRMQGTEQINYRVSDFLQYVDEETIEGIVGHLMSVRLGGKGGYGEHATKVLTEEMPKHIDECLERNGGIEDVDVSGIWEKLRAEGLVLGECPRVVRGDGTLDHHISALFRVLIVSDAIMEVESIFEMAIAYAAAMIRKGLSGDDSEIELVKEHYKYNKEGCERLGLC